MRLIIPEQLRNMEFRFVKIKPNSKEASEKNWNESYNYKYDEISFKDYLKDANSYGVLGGLDRKSVV